MLKTDEERFSARAKVHFDEQDGEETLMRIHLYIDEFGQLVLSDHCHIRPNISGRTDADAFARVRGELFRRGFELP